MKWTETAWQRALPVYEAILKLPFLTEMAEGTLSRERFLFYIAQDNLYIKEYSRVLSHIASRLGDFDRMASFIKFAGDGVAVERMLHAGYLQGAEAAEMSEACLFYTSFLKAQALEDVAVETAAILPCFWIYLEVGKHVLSVAKMDDNPYADWIRAYSDPAFEESNARCMEICDWLAANASEETRRKMTEAYLQASRQEWLFWHSAYNLGKLDVINI